MRIYYLIALLLTVSFCTCKFINQEKSASEQVLQQYRKDVQSLIGQVNKLDNFIRKDVPAEQIRNQFKKSRHYYKRIEWLTEYYNSYTAKFINGPALREVEEDQKEIIIYPEGFQVIEEIIYPVYATGSKEDLLRQVSLLKINIKRVQSEAELLQTTDAHIFDALRLQLYRIITLGVSGFDSPLAKNSVSEAAASIEAISMYYAFYEPKVESTNEALNGNINKLFSTAQTALAAVNDFDKFDRATFILDYANPLSEYLLAAQKELNILSFKEPRPLAADAPTLFSAGVFNPDFYAPGADSYTSASKVQLGRRLFYDKQLSGNGKVSCGSCHQPGKAFTDALITSVAINGKDLKRNAPTLINSALQASLFYDSRVAFLEDQANEVLLNKDEMHGSFENMLIDINNDKGLRSAFVSVYNSQTVTEQQIKNAIASYLRSLVSLNSKFDLYMRGDRHAMSKEELRGFNLFMGKARCGTCHFVPLFNGTLPPTFVKSEAEVIGVPAGSDTINAVIDGDPGKYVMFQIGLHTNAFKTPGLRNVALTAPYMHNGVYKTLGEVIDFYDRGGGGGLGFDIDNLTLPKASLKLSSNEKKALVAFMKCLTDTTGLH